MSGATERAGVPRAVLAATFLPFAWKAVDYATLGSFVPLALLGVFVVTVATGVRAGGRAARRSVRLWCAAMVLWGLVRLLLMALVLASGLDEAHVQAQMTVPFALSSLAHLIVGGVLWRRA